MRVVVVNNHVRPLPHGYYRCENAGLFLLWIACVRLIRKHNSTIRCEGKVQNNGTPLVAWVSFKDVFCLPISYIVMGESFQDCLFKIIHQHWGSKPLYHIPKCPFLYHLEKKGPGALGQASRHELHELKLLWCPFLSVSVRLMWNTFVAGPLFLLYVNFGYIVV